MLAAMGLALLALACGDDGGSASTASEKTEPAQAAAPPTPVPPKKPGRRETPDDLPNGLVLALSAFPEGSTDPLPAELEFIVRKGGEWIVTRLTDDQSNVFHKAMAYETPAGETKLLTGAGEKALLKLWTRQADGSFSAETIWEKDFGGQFSRMRDIEVGDIDGNGTNVMAVATHDQGVVAVVRPNGDGYAVEELDLEKDTFVHEVELGDVDGDGAMEIYATPSEPNKLDGSHQSGQVVRYVPSKGEGRVVVADLGDRHAKEILVDDIDGNGKDELYVIVEGQVDSETKRMTHRTEIWRYEADTPADQGVVVAELDDRLGRFLTPADLDGDGKKEIVAALFAKGVWWLRPGDDPTKPWRKKAIDRRSSSFEHAAIALDLDEDGQQELYVASDNQGEIRRYVWNGRRLVKEVIYERNDPRSILTWNIMPIPVGLAGN
ncbi:unnamed protein product [Discosporangium mesarthrocarpum]